VALLQQCYKFGNATRGKSFSALMILDCDRTRFGANGPARGGTIVNHKFKAAVAACMLVGFSGSVAAGPQEDAALALLRGDYATAERLFRPLADQGDAFAQSTLGVMYATGRGVTQNYGAAVNWYRKAADQGHAQGQAGLGVMYMTGQGVPKD